MKIDELMKMTVEELLEKFCIVYSPECGYNYGITRWEDVYEIYEEFDLEEEYCFSGDSLIPIDYGFDHGETVLELKDLKCIMDRLGIQKKRPCPKCNSDNYHFDYNKMTMVCGECNYIEETEEGGN